MIVVQLRSGHCPKTKYYRHRIGMEDNAACERCGEVDGGQLGGVPGNSPPIDGGGRFGGAALGGESGGEVHSEGLSAMAGRLNVPSPQQQQQRNNAIKIYPV